MNPLRIIFHGLRVLLRRWIEEPVGVAVPLITMLIILNAGQMSDMFAGVAEGEASILAFGLSNAFLGFSSWYWTRAALQESECYYARSKIFHPWYAPRPVNNGDLPKLKKFLDLHQQRLMGWGDWSRKWAPRLAILISGIIALTPAWVSLGSSSLKLSAVSLVCLFLVFCFSIWRRNHMLAKLCPTPGWMWRFRPTATLAAAPFGWAFAILMLILSAIGTITLALRPEWVEAVFSTPSAAMLSLGLVIGPLVMALAFLRSFFSFVLLSIFTAVEWTTVRRRGGGPVKASPIHVKAVSRSLGLATFIGILFFSLTGESDKLYTIRRPESSLSCNPADPDCLPAGIVLTRPDIQTAVADWVEARRADHPRGTAMPMIVVAAEGGASRASAWLLSAMQLLDRQTNGRFGHYLFAISGVSGGSHGAVTYLQALRHYPRGDGGVAWDHACVQKALNDLAGGDMLAGSVATYFLNDTLGRLAGPNWPAIDRGIALERSFERHWSEGLCIDLAEVRKGFLELRGRDGALPHLFLNGTDAKLGRRLITSTVQFDEFEPDKSLFTASDDFLRILSHDVPAATAVMNSARFPFISPAGRFRFANDNVRQVVDGGYFENYGARTAADLSRRISEIGRSHGVELTPIVVVVSNDVDGLRDGDPRAVSGVSEHGRIYNPLYLLKEVTITCEKTKLLNPIIQELRNNNGKAPLSEFLAPLAGLLNTRSGHGAIALNDLKSPLCKSGEPPRLIHIALPEPDKDRDEAAPMNWVLNANTRHFLLDVAPEITFNQTQARHLDDALDYITGSAMVRRDTDQTSR
jgi:hypothetical protein